MDWNQPVNEGGSSLFLYFLLGVHIRRINLPFLFILQHVLLNVRAKLRDVVNIVKSLSVALLHLADDLSLPFLVELLQFLMDRNGRQLLSCANPVRWVLRIWALVFRVWCHDCPCRLFRNWFALRTSMSWQVQMAEGKWWLLRLLSLPYNDWGMSELASCLV